MSAVPTAALSFNVKAEAFLTPTSQKVEKAFIIGGRGLMGQEREGMHHKGNQARNSNSYHPP